MQDDYRHTITTITKMYIIIYYQLFLNLNIFITKLYKSLLFLFCISAIFQLHFETYVNKNTVIIKKKLTMIFTSTNIYRIIYWLYIFRFRYVIHDHVLKTTSYKVPMGNEERSDWNVLRKF